MLRWNLTFSTQKGLQTALTFICLGVCLVAQLEKFHEIVSSPALRAQRQGYESGQILQKEPEVTHFDWKPENSDSDVKDDDAPPELIVQTIGELGNHFQLIQVGLFVHEWMERELGVSTKLKMHQSEGDLRKSASVYRTLGRCFPKLAKSYSFVPPSRQKEWERPDIESIRVTFPLDPAKFSNQTARRHINNSLSEFISSEGRTVAYYLPRSEIPVAKPLFSRSELADRFGFDDLSRNCCPPELPSHNDTVLHVRGFSKELPLDYAERGLFELDPQRTANDLLQHLPKGASIWILSRFTDAALPYQLELESIGHQVRVVVSTNDMHDFCILKNAKRLAGGARSTFFLWSLRLNQQNLERVDLYGMVRPEHNPGKRHCLEFTTGHDNIHCHTYPVLPVPPQ